MDVAMYNNRREVLLPLLIRTQLERRITAVRSTKWRQEIVHRIENKIETGSVSASKSSISSIESLLKQYEKWESIALLRSAVWKVKLKEHGKENETVSDEERGCCLIQSGDEVVTAYVLPFLKHYLSTNTQVSGNKML